jgi:hypothetical protein
MYQQWNTYLVSCFFTANSVGAKLFIFASYVFVANCGLGEG